MTAKKVRRPRKTTTSVLTDKQKDDLLEKYASRLTGWIRAHQTEFTLKEAARVTIQQPGGGYRKILFEGGAQRFIPESAYIGKRGHIIFIGDFVNLEVDTLLAFPENGQHHTAEFLIQDAQEYLEGFRPYAEQMLGEDYELALEGIRKHIIERESAGVLEAMRIKKEAEDKMLEDPTYGHYGSW